MIEAIYRNSYLGDAIIDIQLEALEDVMPAHIRNGIFDEEIKDFKNAVNKVCDSLLTLISESKTKAARINKPLMILLGESHCSMHSLILEGIILYICRNYFDINTVMSENSFEFDLNPSESLAGRRAWSGKIGSWSVDIPISFFLNELGITPKRLDINTRFTRNYESSLSIEGIRARNNEMVHIATEAPNDSVCIVGAWHLPGMLEETSLQETFSVFPINLCEHPNSRRSAAHVALNDYLLSPEKCLQAIDMISDFTHCFPPKMALNLVREICQEKIDERLGYSTIPVSRSIPSKRSGSEITPAYSASCSSSSSSETSSETTASKRQRVIPTDSNNEKYGFCVLI